MRNIRSIMILAGLGASLILAAVRENGPGGMTRGTLILFVDGTRTGGLNSGSTWEDAYLSLQDALADAATNGAVSEIWIAGGVYTPDRGAGFVPGDRTASFQIVTGVSLYGGFAGDESDTDQRDGSSVTVLSGDLSGNDDGTPAAKADNSFHVIKATDTTAGTLIDGLTIRGGNASKSSFPDDRGGGVFASGASPVFTYCTFTGNAAVRAGGAFYSSGGSPTRVCAIFS